MRPFIVTTPQARKLPRWGLLLLCALYVVPGLLGRDPWRVVDATGFGIAQTMFTGSALDWLVPSVFGESVPQQGPLPFALAAALAHALNGLSGVAGSWLPGFDITSHLSVRIATGLGIATMLAFTWRAIYLLARRPGVTPVDPLGAGANPRDFARAIADSGLLITIATFGLIARMHETTAFAAQMVWVAMFLYGLAVSLDAPNRGTVLAALAIGATVATRGLPLSTAMLLTWLLLLWTCQPYTLVRATALRLGLPLSLGLAALWPLALFINGSDKAIGFLIEWLAWNATAMAIPTADTATWMARYVFWFYWPAWPLAAWALLRWTRRMDQPAIAAPTLLAASFLTVAMLARSPGEEWLVPAALPIAALAAMGLPTLRRIVVNLIDWFAVMLFSFLGFAIWAYFLAFLTGWPPRMAFSARQLAPNYLPPWSAIDLSLALLASAAWVMLVAWRISRRPPVIWRAVVLSSGGLCLTWFLLMTLWLPVFNERNTYRGIAQGIAQYVKAESVSGERHCIQARNVGLAERAAIAFHAGIRWERADVPCRFLLVGDYGRRAYESPAAEAGWQFIWEGRRRPNVDERMRLYSLETGGATSMK